jgi:membrane protease YdiL (CAAX protease family)
MTSPTPSEPRTGQQLYHAAPFTLATTVGLTGAAIATIYVTQIIFAMVGAVGLLGSVVGNLLVVAVGWRYARTRGLTLADFGVRRVARRFLAAAALLGISMWYVTLVLVLLLKATKDSSNLQELIEQAPLVTTLLALTIFPALAEELVFRGVLARGLAARVGSVWAMLISAALFGLYHLNPPQMVSTFALGVVLAFLTLRSRSIVPALIVHVLNNMIAVLLSRRELPAVTSFLEQYPIETFATALVCVACGLALTAKGVV